MNSKSKVIFNNFVKYEDGMIACLETFADEIPFNLFVDNADKAKIESGKCCFVDICGVGSEIEVFSSEEEYQKSNHSMASLSMIPIGTFPSKPDPDFVQSPHILFSGKALKVEPNPYAEIGEPNYCVTVETYGMTFTMYCRYDGVISTDYIIHGVAWLFGDLEADSDGK